jgi:hypothetical protein
MIDACIGCTKFANAPADDKERECGICMANHYINEIRFKRTQIDLDVDRFYKLHWECDDRGEIE